MRPSFHDLMMETAWVWSKRGTCSRLRVGAVLADRNRILTQGYNGNMSSMPHCPDPHPEGPCKTATHAESNVLYFAAQRGISTQGTTIYCTHAPCILCVRGIVTSGVERVIYDQPYRDMSGVDLLREAGVRVYSLDWFGV